MPRTTASAAPRSASSGRRWRASIGALLVLGVMAGACWTWSQRHLRHELAAARQEMAAQRYRAAQERLRSLRGWHPRNAEVRLTLGRCEQALGHTDRALALWQGVPVGTPAFAEAAALRGAILTNRGQYAPAESALLAARDQPGPAAHDVRRALARLYRFQGRTEDVRRLIEESWSVAADRVELLRESWTLDGSPVPIDPLRRSLDHADAEDDRVWLGQANLALRVGDTATAARWLQRCRRRRPDDPAVLRAALDLAVATDDPTAVMAAARGLRPEAFTPAETQRLRVFLAEHLERDAILDRELRRLVALEPGNTAALERLAERETRAGQADAAAALRRRKAEIDRARDAYSKLIPQNEGPALLPHAATLADLAARQNRTFEARGWAEIAARGPQGRNPLENLPAAPALSRPGGSLESALADLAPTTGSRPAIAAFVPRPPDFRDDAQDVGLEFTFDAGHTSLAQLPEIMSGGVALLDYDGDGWLDVYCLQGGPCHPAQEHPSDRLFRNRRDGTFEDATQAAGVDHLPRGYGHGAAVGDYDNDGDPDLFLTRLGSYALLRNRGDGTFEDATETTGLAGVRDWPTSAAFADLDADGDLDLYVAHYARWDPGDPRLCLNQEKQAYFYCNPSVVPASVDHVLRNDDGRFVDVTTEAGFTDPDGRGLGVVAADLDGDHRLDLYVANDGTANYLFRNLGGFRFEEIGEAAGVAGNAQGGYQAGMGVACGDLDRDGRPDLFVTNFYGEGATFYHNLGGGLFVDRSAESGLLRASRFLLGFGVVLIDYDRDGRLDLMMAHGNVNDNRPFFPFAMPTRLLAGDGAGKLLDVTAAAGPPWDRPHLGRALASGDLDNDGRVDALLIAQNEPLVSLHNRTDGGHFLTLSLEGTRSNRDGVGAVVTVTAGGPRQVAQRMGGGSYLGASDPRLSFGLGDANRVEGVEVRWPSGQVDRFPDLQADRAYLLREGEPTASELRPSPSG